MCLFLDLLVCIVLFISANFMSNHAEEYSTSRYCRERDLTDPPDSGEVQELAEAMYLDKQVLTEIFPRNKKKVDVCKLPSDKTKKVCSRLERLRKYKGSYFFLSNATIGKCEQHKLLVHHTIETPAFEDALVRKCPFRPNPLFLLSGNNRVPVFVLTWSGEEKTSLHIDYFSDG